MFDNIRNFMQSFLGMGNNTNRSRGYQGNRYRSSMNYKLIPFDQAKDMIEKNTVLLMDVRTSNEYDLMHIKNAINIPVNEIEQKILQVEQDKPLMVYCSSGARSKTAIQILNNLGYNNIYIWEYGALATFPYKNMLEYGENGRII
ncbi:MAG: rhodanese-like domain-containing protein [Christensenellales bacterium]|jgi:rhodanese-related sulfurtransferase|nr:sulfurtransferase [Clostridium sp. CAG:465]